MPDDTQRQDPEKLRTSGKSGAGRADTDETQDTYEPSSIEVNRARERGLGVGQKDLDYQHDPTGVTPAERWVNPEPPPRVRPPEPLPPELDPPPDN